MMRTMTDRDRMEALAVGWTIAGAIAGGLAYVFGWPWLMPVAGATAWVGWKLSGGHDWATEAIAEGARAAEYDDWVAKAEEENNDAA